MTPEQLIDIALTIIVWFVALSIPFVIVSVAFYVAIDKSTEAHERNGEGGQ